MPAEVSLGETVAITLRLTNVSPRPVEAHFLGRDITFDIVVAGEDGAVVWQRLAGQAVPSILQMRMLAPGQSMEWADQWRPARTGRYRVEGVLPSDAPEPLRSPVVPLLVK